MKKDEKEKEKLLEELEAQKDDLLEFAKILSWNIDVVADNYSSFSAEELQEVVNNVRKIINNIKRSVMPKA